MDTRVGRGSLKSGLISGTEAYKNATLIKLKKKKFIFIPSPTPHAPRKKPEITSLELRD